MYNHNSTVFNHSCLKVPRNPKLDEPLTNYEKKSEYVLESDRTDNTKKSEDSKKKFIDRKSMKSFLDFFNTIPEYDDINHLSNKEFYKKLEALKEKQKFFEDSLNNEIKFDGENAEWIEDYKNLKLSANKNRRDLDTKKKPNLKPFCTTPILKNTNLYFDFLLDKDTYQPTSRRSVRIETPSENFSPEQSYRPKSRANISSASSKRGGNLTDWEDLSMENLNLNSENTTPLPTRTRSAPSSPSRTKDNDKWDECGITIPKPFQMTVRDEENKIVEELFVKMRKPKEDKPKQFKAHDIPIESQIPLFDRIMADQERRSFLIKERRKADLQAQMKPFSFTKRDEEIQELTREISKSSPDLYSDAPIRIKKFKAKPIPKNLFSNYIYRKMHEDEYYRALQKKIRAEEMLRAASLPPSMAKREKTNSNLNVCPRSYRRDSSKEERVAKKSRSAPNFKQHHDKIERELEELKNEFISTSPRPFKLKTSKRGKRHQSRNSSASSKSSTKTTTPSSLDLQSVNRSNLAAILRIQSARHKLESEMISQLEEAKLKEEARWREKLMRKKPVWQALAYSNEEDLAMRLQLRRDEEKLRNEEHRMRMQLMLGRVNQQPTLFERQSQMIHQKNKDDFARDIAFSKKKSRRYLTDSSDLNKFLVEMKDEAIQAYLEDHPKSENSEMSKEDESQLEEKEQCDCSSDENYEENEIENMK